MLENEMHKILSSFEIQTDRLIPARKQDLMLINKKKKELIINWNLPSQRTTRVRPCKLSLIYLSFGPFSEFLL